LHHDERIFDVLEGGQNRDQIEALKNKADVLAAKFCGLPPALT
jgi:hypothetical protein